MTLRICYIENNFFEKNSWLKLLVSNIACYKTIKIRKVSLIVQNKNKKN